MRVAGIHSPNNRGVTEEDITMWQGINPGVILLCQPYMALARELKERIPGVYIIGRVFGGNGFDAWHPKWTDADWMYRYGVFCGEMANQFAVDCIQFANEPGIDDNNPWMWSREGYEAQRHGSYHWLRGFRSVTTKEAGTCVQSPGHHFDDDPDGEGWTGAGIVKDVWQKFDVLLCHSYMTRDPGTIESEWWGRRYRREVAALGWTKRTIVTETNRDEPTPPNDEDRKSLAEFYRQWYAGSEVESCFFIWDTADPNFARLTMKDNPWLIDVAAEANTRVVDPAPPIPEPETPPLNIPAVLVAAALVLAPGPQHPASKPLVWDWHEPNITAVATYRPTLSADDVLTIAFGLGGTIYQESGGKYDARGDFKNGYYCSRGLFQLNTCSGAGVALMKKYGISADELDDPTYQYEHAKELILALEAELYWSRQENRLFNPGKAIQSVQRSSSDPTGAGYQAAYDTLRREATATQEAPLATARIGNLDIPDLRPRYPSTYTRRPLSAIENIGIHHSATPTLAVDATEGDELAAMDAIHRYHREQFRGISYHMVVMPSGRCYLTGEWDTVRYLVGGDGNISTLGLLLHGTFMDASPGDAQIDAAHRLIANVRYQLGNAGLPVVGHKDIASEPTACPGATWETWKGRLVDTPQPVDTRTPLHIQLDSLYGLIGQLGDHPLAVPMRAAVLAAKDAAEIQ